MLIEEYNEILDKENVRFEDLRLVCEDAIKEIEKRDIKIKELKKNQLQSGIQLETEEQQGILIAIIEQSPMQGSFLQVREATNHLNQLLNSLQTATIIAK
ncbi:hypothetical protein [Planococcus dechangensis]|uniref:Uncharacterized protein n=1 Tax=Planococcus dechangensis TaxID=1176255 RepID=A0ABV9M9J4_9BACL